MDKYNKDNIDGIVFSCSGSSYKVSDIKGKNCRITSLDSSYTDKNYEIEWILEEINNNTWKVIQEPVQSYMVY